VQLLRHKRSQQSAADAFARQHLLHRCVGVWTAAVAARHAKQAQLATALHLRQHNLLMKGWQGFLLLQQDTQHERRELAAAAAPALRVLNRLKQRWMLRAWLAAAQQQQQERALVSGKHVSPHRRGCAATPSVRPCKLLGAEARVRAHWS
jgi:hypothetical protein